MKTEKEIIDEIVNRLKSQPERAYRPGAWEGFNDQYGNRAKKIQQISRWAASVAACLLIGIGSVYYISDTTKPTVSRESEVASTRQTPIDEYNVAPLNTPMHKEGYHTAPLAEKGNTANAADNAIGNKIVSSDKNSTVDRFLALSVVSDVIRNINARINISSNELNPLSDDNRKYSSIGTDPVYPHSINRDQLALATSSNPNSDLKIREVENITQNKRVRFGDKFDLALFVSPYSTGDKMNVGGGLTFAYNLTNKLSVRTGASYNSYEMGMLKNPTEPNSYEAVIVNNNSDASKNMAGLAAPQSSRMIIPNINAVTGIVQSVDVPIEMKYNVGRSLYAVAGVSYSAIIGQERNAHYVENVNTETFSHGFPENEKQIQTAVKAVTKTVKSAEKNVSTDGFNGFVNFSIGKKVNVNNRFGVSIEPYLKIPIGEYRRADMDYTNGGIRIMTNF
ncbi:MULTISPECIES: outer membrane beta-barrel protein [Sphingobacterium]|uniref:outer membrane beta-barrel protein n=1 Tax=Sphingobacterium TaxID=28453 RepID=UPI0013DD29F7|nr:MULTISPECIES: outer membrane beta-barrel protein [unclassified Sphingobacterium]